MSLYQSRPLIAYGNFIFHYRDKLFPVVLLLLLIAFPPPADSAGEWSLTRDLAAMLVAFVGEGIRMLTVGLEYIKRGGVNKRIFAEHLVSGGVFAHCRNPLYVGNVLLAVALLSIPGSWALFGVGLVLVLITYIAIVAAEEQFLRGKFGAEFDVYCGRVNRWVPDFRGFGATLNDMSFNWRRVLLKETSSFYAWIILAVLLAAYEQHFVGVFDSPGFLAFFTLFVAATLGFAAIRLLKQAKVLRLNS